MNLKKWQVVRNVTLGIIALFLFLTVSLGFMYMFDDGIYPDGIFGLTRFQAFRSTMTFIFVFTCIPLLIDVLIFVFSIFKIKKIKSNTL